MDNRDEPVFLDEEWERKRYHEGPREDPFLRAVIGGAFWGVAIGLAILVVGGAAAALYRVLGF